MRRTWLICLMLALLPWRAWAWSVMPLAPAGEPSALQAVATASEQGDPAVHPGHRACHDDGSLAHPTHPTHPAQLCGLCDICHAGLIAPALWRPPVVAPGDTAPPDWACERHGRPSTCELYRPPRG